MAAKKKDIIIASLEFARDKFLRGEFVNRGDFSNFLVSEKYIELGEVDRKRHLITALFEQIASFQDPEFGLPTRFMGMDSYLALQDYEELQLARQDSAHAREEAKEAIKQAEHATRLTEKALFWTKVSVIAAIILGVMQIIFTFAIG